MSALISTPKTRIEWGLLLGRAKIFEAEEKRVRLATRAFWWGVLGFVALYPNKQHLADWGLAGLRHSVVNNSSST